jgi:putative nucleotidyltransferase with HDIG domain
MPNRAKLYFIAVTVVAVAAVFPGVLALLSMLQEIPAFISTHPGWEGLVVCVVIGLFAEAMAVEFKIGLPGYQARSSLAFLPFICAITLFPVSAAVLAIVVVLAVSQFGLRRITTLKALFNISQGAIAGYIAGTTYRAIFVGPSYFTDPTFLLGFSALVCTFFFANMMLSSVALSLLENARFSIIFRQVVGTNGANLLYDVLASPIALVPAAFGQPWHGMLVILAPLMLFQYSYQSNQKVIERSHQILRALVKAIETRDPHTSGHSIRVMTLAKAVAADLNVPVRVMNQIEMAALLHDIGKIYPEFSAVLSKPYSLTPDEIALIQTHAARGAEMIQSISSVPAEVTAAVRNHHERFDGRGYPDGLSGNSIPLAARIIMLCDSVDAMLSDRPYRKALSIAEVRAEVERCSGSQFDPAIVQVFLDKHTLERAVHLIAADSESDSWGHAVFA